MQTQSSRAKLAMQAALYALPLVIMDLTREATFARLTSATPNRFFHVPILANASSRMVIRPNVDTLYSSAWLDLDVEPVVMTMPPSNERYFILQCMDAWTNVFAAPGMRTLGNTSATYAIAGPEWHGSLPEEAVELHSPTPTVWVLGRIYVRDQADLPAARAYQRQLDLRPLSRLHDASFLPAYPRLQQQHSVQRLTMMETLQQLGPQAFFERFMHLIVSNPPASQDAQFIQNVLEPLGLAPGQSQTWEHLNETGRHALATGLRQALEGLTSRASLQRHHLLTPTGWSRPASDYPQGNYSTDYQARAVVAALGLGANLRADTIYLNTCVDAKENRLDGSQQYCLTFEAGNLPPAQVFWSVTLYDETGYLVANSFSRHAVRSGDSLVYEPDGSLVLFLQSDDPGPRYRANWLPTPRGQAFDLSLRTYWPTEALLEERWMPPPVVPIV